MQRSVRKETKPKTGSAKLKKAVKTAVAKEKTSSAASKPKKESKAQKPRVGSGKRRETIIEEFRSFVNIPKDELARWLSTPESQKLRFPDEPKNGRRSGQIILKILAKRHDKVTKEDVEYMRTVIEFIAARLPKRPKGDIVASNWRYALMNWGHDPSKPLKRTRGARTNGR